VNNARILLIVGGGVAAYKTLDLVRRLRERGASVRAVLTRAGAEFVTPLSLATLTGEQVFTHLFDLKDEAEIGHIQLSRQADLVVVAPATADLMAKMAHGLADDLATTLLLATDKRVLIAPAMNVRMWEHPATRRNAARLREDGVLFAGPDEGEMACGEFGMGRMTETPALLAAIEAALAFHAVPAARPNGAPLAGRHVLITAGPTHERIDPVRYIANRSSGKQGVALARAALGAGARVTLVLGPSSETAPHGAATIRVETAEEMLAATRAALPADIAICAAAVADWRAAEEHPRKWKKNGGETARLDLVRNPDILASLGQAGAMRPSLLIGFAAETCDIVANAAAKRAGKGADWIVANDVSHGTGIMGGADNRIHLVTASGVENWPLMPKDEVAKRLIARAAESIAPIARAAE
jgi:phosphopantothenoylcysteine decarboxylase/phosphopantothenate--cysteine ligase